MRHGAGRCTVVDLIALLVIGLSVAVVGIAAADKAHARSVSNACMDNLRGIGVALVIYQQHHREWPRARYDPDDATLNAYTAPHAANPFAADGPAVNDVTAAYYLLVDKDLPAETFVCPHSPLGRLPTAAGQRPSNFADEIELNYSFANPYPSRAAVLAGYKLDTNITAEFPIASDMNPGDPGLLLIDLYISAGKVAPYRSRNHRPPRDTMNVLYGDLHVDAVSHPFVGVQRDNIFTFGGHTAKAGGLGIVGSPVGKDDAVLLPVANLARWQPLLDREKNADHARVVSYLLLGAIPLLALLAALVWLIRRRQSREFLPPAALP